jgi:hypothetical protein
MVSINYPPIRQFSARHVLKNRGRIYKNEVSEVEKIKGLEISRIYFTFKRGG